jgi:iron complex outermembrane receptor protein
MRSSSLPGTLAAALLALAGGTGVAWAQAAGASASTQPPSRDLTTLSLEELANVEITSVSRRPERLGDAPASVYVITSDDIRRAGARTLAEALRLAPNLLVARLDTGQYAISARGFNSLVANKLLVLVDGRTIYTPLFSGVFWDQQDVMVEDIERIEVISGPGATLWGANAVNGVINILTRSARATTGPLVSLGGGNREQAAALRYGHSLGGRGHFRVYGKGTNYEPTQLANGNAVLDGRYFLQGGFRADWEGARDSFTLQGDAYRGRSDDRGVILTFVLGRVELTGLNVLGRWTRRFSEKSELSIQGYYDYADREEKVLFQPTSKLADLEVQHALTAGSHRLVTGAGYRHGSDEVVDGILLAFRPRDRALAWFNVYAQDDVRLHETLDLSAGIKLERNDYTGWEYLPSARLAWKPGGGHLLWGAASRAVRAPARLDREVVTPDGLVRGGPNFQSEIANVFELGYRAQPLSAVTLSVTGYHYDWDRLRSGTSLPVTIENRIEGPTYGIEAWASWQPATIWRLNGGLLALRKRLRLEPGSTDPVGAANPQLANDPGHQWMLRSSLTLRNRHDVDAVVRHIGNLKNTVVPAYTAVDVRYGFRVRPDLELSLLGQNVFDAAHPEFGAAANRSEFERGFFVQARWSR